MYRRMQELEHAELGLGALCMLILCNICIKTMSDMPPLCGHRQKSMVFHSHMEVQGETLTSAS